MCGVGSIFLGVSMQVGYNLAVLNQSMELIKEHVTEGFNSRSPDDLVDSKHPKVTFYWSLLNWSLSLGGILGSMIIGKMADSFGRKKAMLIMQVFSIGGALLFELGYRLLLPELLVLARFVIGVYVGFSGSFGPLFLSELSPTAVRGRIVIGHQVSFTLGMFTSALLGLSSVLGTRALWHYTVLLNVLPCLVSFALCTRIRDSPRYLAIVKQDHAAAITALQFYRGHQNVQEEFEEIKQEAKVLEQETDKYSIYIMFTNGQLRKHLLIGMALVTMQQFSGINAIFFYSVGIYKAAGIKVDLIEFAVLSTTAVFVLSGLVSIPLLDRIGRKPLLLYPMSVMMLGHVMLTVSLNLKYMEIMPYISLAMVLLIVMGFSLGLGGIPLMLSAELFTQVARPYAMSVIGTVLWSAVFIVSLTFEHIHALCGDFTFLLFASSLLISIVFVYCQVPETKNKTFKDISSTLNDNQQSSDIQVLHRM